MIGKPTLPFEVRMEWDPDDKMWVTYVPALNNLSTYGDTYQQALEQTREAILGYLEAADKEQLPLPFDSEQARAFRGSLIETAGCESRCRNYRESAGSGFSKPCSRVASRSLTLVAATTT
jgi:predicted RNase H-like HicB family nuclease